MQFCTSFSTLVALVMVSTSLASPAPRPQVPGLNTTALTNSILSSSFAQAANGLQAGINLAASASGNGRNTNAGNPNTSSNNTNTTTNSPAKREPQLAGFNLAPFINSIVNSSTAQATKNLNLAQSIVAAAHGQSQNTTSANSTTGTNITSTNTTSNSTTKREPQLAGFNLTPFINSIVNSSTAQASKNLNLAQSIVAAAHGQSQNTTAVNTTTGTNTTTTNTTTNSTAKREPQFASFNLAPFVSSISNSSFAQVNKNLALAQSIVAAAHGQSQNTTAANTTTGSNTTTTNTTTNSTAKREPQFASFDLSALLGGNATANGTGSVDPSFRQALRQSLRGD